MVSNGVFSSSFYLYCALARSPASLISFALNKSQSTIQLLKIEFINLYWSWSPLFWLCSIKLLNSRRARARVSNTSHIQRKSALDSSDKAAKDLCKSLSALGLIRCDSLVHDVLQFINQSMLNGAKYSSHFFSCHAEITWTKTELHFYSIWTLSWIFSLPLAAIETNKRKI